MVHEDLWCTVLAGTKLYCISYFLRFWLDFLPWFLLFTSRVACSSPRTQMRTMCKRYPTSARCCRSRSTRNAWAMTQLDTVPCTTITTCTTWPATTTQRSRRSKWNPTYRSRVKAPTLFLCPGSGGESTVLYCQFLNYRWRLCTALIVVVTIDLILTFNLKYSAIKQSWSVLRIYFTNVTFVLVMLVKMEVHFLYLDVRVSVWVVPPIGFERCLLKRSA